MGLMMKMNDEENLYEGFRCGFVGIVGRPNVGKSTLLNALVGKKVSIASPRPNTTRFNIRGVLTEKDCQIVFVDTPGIHRPKTLLGERLNQAANEAIGDVDLNLAVLDASVRFGPGDKRVLGSVSNDSFVVLNKCDKLSQGEIFKRLTEASEICGGEFFPVSARTGRGLEELVSHIGERLPLSPPLYPSDMVSDLPKGIWVADLVREQLLAIVREELPHSIATRVVEWEPPRIRVEILVERDSQKGIVIGKDGAVLKRVGTLARAQLPKNTFLELFVRVERNWQASGDALSELGI